jgi:fructose-bisphosphate aldolase class I
LFTAPGIENYISGVILFQEQVSLSNKFKVTQLDSNGVKFADLLTSKGIVPGIKVDKGLKILPGTKDESATMGTINQSHL